MQYPFLEQTKGVEDMDPIVLRGRREKPTPVVELGELQPNG